MIELMKIIQQGWWRLIFKSLTRKRFKVF